MYKKSYGVLSEMVLKVASKALSMKLSIEIEKKNGFL